MATLRVVFSDQHVALGLRYRSASICAEPNDVGRVAPRRVTFGGVAPIYYKMVIHFYKSGADRAAGPVLQEIILFYS